MTAAKGKQQAVARQQFVGELDGKTVVVLAGARFPANHPLVKERATMFEPQRTRKAK